MPIQKCTLPEGGDGFKYGDSGQCYKNRKDAVRQGVAIEISKRSKMKSDLISLYKQDALELLDSKLISNDSRDYILSQLLLK